MSVNIRQKNGRYYARFHEKGRTRKEVTLSTTRKSVARKKARRLEDAWARGDYDPWRGGWLVEDRTLEAAGEAFLEEKRGDGLQPNTISVYHYVLEGLKQHSPPAIMVRDVTPQNVRSYVHAKKEEGGRKKSVSNATKRHRYDHLRTFFRWAIEQGWADENPVEKVKKPRKEEKKKAFLLREDVARVLKAIDDHHKKQDGKPGPTPNDAWLKDIIQVAVGTGLRRGELLNLRWGDIDLNAGRVFVRNREDFKAKNGQERTVPLVGEALQVLREMSQNRVPDPNDIVFLDPKGKSPRPDRVSKRFKFYVRKAELKDQDDLRFHSLRHSTASWLTIDGVPKKVVAEVLGHTTTRMADVYSHLAPGVVDQAMQKTFGQS
jgi:integrase